MKSNSLIPRISTFLNTFDCLASDRRQFARANINVSLKRKKEKKNDYHATVRAPLRIITRESLNWVKEGREKKLKKKKTLARVVKTGIQRNAGGEPVTRGFSREEIDARCAGALNLPRLNIEKGDFHET